MLYTLFLTAVLRISEAPATQPVGPPNTRVEMSQIPALPARPLRELVSISINNGMLQASSQLPEITEIRRVPTTDSKIEFVASMSNSENAVLNLSKYDYDAAGEVVTLSGIISSPGTIQLFSDSDTGENIRNVALIQTTVSDPTSTDLPVRLTVQQMAGDQKLVDLKLAESSFDELCRKHPLDVRKFVLPILSDLGAADIITHNDRIAAYQMFAKDIPSDPALQAKLDDLIKRLDNDDYAIRQKAQAELDELGQAAYINLSRLDMNKLAPEPRDALQGFMSKHRAYDAASIALLSADVPFLLDVCSLNDKTLRPLAAKQISKITGETFELPATLSDADAASKIAAWKTAHQPTTQPTKPSPTEPKPSGDKQ